MKRKCYKKLIVGYIIFLFIGAGCVPIINGKISKITHVKEVRKEIVNEESLTVELEALPFNLTETGDGYCRIKMDGGIYGGSPGNPLLPYNVYNILRSALLSIYPKL